VKRALYWLGVMTGVALMTSGVIVAVQGYLTESAPEGVVRGYFAALQKGDAAAALAYGRIPAGPRTLLTSAALHEQQHIAPIKDIGVGPAITRGRRASVAVSYVLAYPGKDVPVSLKVGLHKSGSSWRLDAVAVRTELQARAARQRQSILGATVAGAPVLLFPGMLPIRFDTPYLQLDPVADNVTLESLSTTYVHVELTGAGRAAMVSAVRAGIQQCVQGGAANAACPLPDERYVPHSVRGQLRGMRVVDVSLDSTAAAGVVRFEGTAPVTGSWQRLDFDNRQHTGHGTASLTIRAIAYATAPLQLQWEPA
jgi:hypothetical protein